MFIKFVTLLILALTLQLVARGYAACATEPDIDGHINLIEGTSVADNAYSGCSSLKSVSIDGSITAIGVSAFSNCTSLSSVSFGSNSKLETIGEKAFLGPNQLTSITILDSVKNIGNEAFSQCGLLDTVVITEQSVLESIGMGAFDSTQINSIDLPPTLQSIGSSAFYDTLLSTVSIPGDGALTSIGNSAFQKTPLVSISFNTNLETIGNYAFNLCSNLTTVSFPSDSKLQSVGVSAFASGGVTSIVFPQSLTTLEAFAFKECKNLGSATFAVGNKIKVIGSGAFQGTALSNLVIESPELITIGPNAFYQASELSNLKIGCDAKVTIMHDALTGTAMSSIALNGESSCEDCGVSVTKLDCPSGKVSTNAAPNPMNATVIGVAVFGGITLLAAAYYFVFYKRSHQGEGNLAAAELSGIMNPVQPHEDNTSAF